MSEFLSMGGNGAFVWSAYAVTLAALVWNVWSARRRLRQKLVAARDYRDSGEPVKQARVSQIQED